MVSVKATSSVDATQQPYLHGWDTAARQYHSFFELKKQSAADNLLRLRANPFTQWRGLIQVKNRYTTIDTLTYRQQLGEISQAEVAEVNQALGGRYSFSRARDEPAKLYAYDSAMLGVYFLAGATIGAYGFFVKRYNMLWIPAGFAPFTTALVMNHLRQPVEEMQNAYRYLLEKRAASCVYEKTGRQLQAECEEVAQMKDLLLES